MSCTLQVVVGPAGSGKTRHLARRYAEKLARRMAGGGFGSGLWIAPNRLAVDHVTQLVLQGLPGGCLSPQIHTFEGFSEEILRLAPTPVRPVTRLQARHLLRQTVQRLAADGELPYLAHLADSRGLIDTLAAQIRELKRLEIWPEEFAAACARPAMRPKDRDLARIYQSYQQALQEHHLYDAEGRFWSARTLLRDGHRQALESVELVVVDGFTDFMPPQHEMLQVLAEAADEMWISLLVDDVPNGETRHAPRADLFSKPLATLDELRNRHGKLVIHHAGDIAHSEGAPCRVFGRLFRPPASRPKDERGKAATAAIAKTHANQRDAAATSGRRIAVWEMVSPLQEVRGVVRDIKANWTAGKTRLEDVVVVLRSLHSAAALVEEVFAEYGVPAYIETKRSLEAAPFIRNLLLLFELDHGDWRYDDLLAVIRNRRLRWHLPDGGDNAKDAQDAQHVRRAAERLVRRLQIPSGREALFRQVDRLARESRDEETAAQAAVVAESLGRLAEFLGRLPREATPAAWAAEVDRVFGLCSPTAADEEAAKADAVDERARARLVEALHQVQRLDEEVHGRPRVLSRGGALELVADMAAHEVLPQPVEMAGRVRVLSAISARGVEAEVVYFIGLDEHAMPVDSTSQAYYGEREIGRLIRAGLPLVSAARRYEEEMLLFYEVGTRARRELVLSYPALDAKAQPALPSPFIAEVRRVGGEDVAVRRQLELRPVDRIDSPLCPREFRTRAVCDAVVDGGEADRLERLAGDGTCRDVAGAVLDGLKIVAARSRRDAFGPAEGIFASEAAARSLAAAFGPAHHWSPTALERYAVCPFRFLLERVLDVEPLEDLELTTDYRRRGSLAHRCLLELYRRLGAELDRTVAVSKQIDEETLKEHVLAFVKEASERLAGGGFWHALEALDLQQVGQFAEVLHEQQKGYDGWGAGLDYPLRPAHFEVRFGPARDGAETQGEDPLSTDRPFALDLGDEQVLLTGRVDRIDVGGVGEREVFSIIDYKTGKAKPLRAEDVKSGLQLQIPLYALAVEELLLSESGAVALHADYWWLREHGFGNKRQGPFALRQIEDGELIERDDWKELKADLLARIRQIIHDIRAGKFAVYSQDADCTRTCPYDGVCRIGHVRSLEKVWGVDE